MRICRPTIGFLVLFLFTFVSLSMAYEKYSKEFKALVTAAQKGDNERAKLIITQFKIDLKNKNGYELLSKSFEEYDNLELAKFLIVNGAPVNLEKKSVLTAAVSKYYDLALFRWLIECGANVNATTTSGRQERNDSGSWFTISQAVIERNFATDSKLDLYKLLVESGANVHRPRLTLGIIKCTESSNGVRYSRSKLSTVEQTKEILEFLFSKGMKLNPSGYRTPLFAAVELNNLPLAEYLVAIGSDVNCRYVKTNRTKHNKEESREIGQTALHHAVINNNMKMVELLLRKGADVNAKRHEPSERQKKFKFTTALELAIGYSKDREIADYLRQNGAEGTLLTLGR